jgi:hypothetical protein
MLKKFSIRGKQGLSTLISCKTLQTKGIIVLERSEPHPPQIQMARIFHLKIMTQNILSHHRNPRGNLSRTSASFTAQFRFRGPPVPAARNGWGDQKPV